MFFFIILWKIIALNDFSDIVVSLFYEKCNVCLQELRHWEFTGRITVWAEALSCDREESFPLRYCMSLEERLSFYDHCCLVGEKHSLFVCICCSIATGARITQAAGLHCERSMASKSYHVSHILNTSMFIGKQENWSNPSIAKVDFEHKMNSFNTHEWMTLNVLIVMYPTQYQPI